MQDQALLALASQILDALNDSVSEEAREFAHDLLTDTQHLMGFVFVHEITENKLRYEGATLSLGRINGRRYRDRLDIIVESRIENEESLGLSRVRIFIDPYRRETKDILWEGVINSDWNAAAYALFDSLSKVSLAWAEDTQRWWQHWTVAYIDYFGPRQWRLTKSLFYVPPEDIDVDTLSTKKQAAC
ncbi:MAG: hypothetical protein OEW08_03145 [Gammaproteobacteria bacterium]|nr:hypothetical protein [Gammaproteobacteria bacterium]